MNVEQVAEEIAHALTMRQGPLVPLHPETLHAEQLAHGEAVSFEVELTEGGRRTIVVVDQ